MEDARVLNVVLYTRQGCHLCEVALQCLQSALQDISHSLLVLDVDTNSEWLELYTECVPVIVINGKVRFRGRVNPVLLRRVLHAEGTRAE